jgi:hypothetical protein
MRPHHNYQNKAILSDELTARYYEREMNINILIKKAISVVTD